MILDSGVTQWQDLEELDEEELKGGYGNRG